MIWWPWVVGLGFLCFFLGMFVMAALSIDDEDVFFGGNGLL